MADKADWRISEKYRKPRRTKGTPFYSQRNYYAIGGLVFGAVGWYLYELWPETKKLKQSLADGKFDIPAGLKTKISHIQASRKAGVEELLAKAREREIQKYAPDKPEEQSWFVKLLTSTPDI